MADLIDRQEAIDTAIEAADKWDGGYSSEREGIIRKFFDKVPAVQPDHNADVSKKVSISCGQENDLISRQAAIDAMKDMYRAAEKWLRDATDDMTKARAESCMASLVEIKLRTEKLPAVQPDRDVIDDCLYHIYKNISVHTATGGVIAIRYYMEKLYVEIYGEGERPWWMT